MSLYLTSRPSSEVRRALIAAVLGVLLSLSQGVLGAEFFSTESDPEAFAPNGPSGPFDELQFTPAFQLLLPVSLAAMSFRGWKAAGVGLGLVFPGYITTVLLLARKVFQVVLLFSGDGGGSFLAQVNGGTMLVCVAFSLVTILSHAAFWFYFGTAYKAGRRTSSLEGAQAQECRVTRLSSIVMVIAVLIGAVQLWFRGLPWLLRDILSFEPRLGSPGDVFLIFLPWAICAMLTRSRFWRGVGVGFATSGLFIALCLPSSSPSLWHPEMGLLVLRWSELEEYQRSEALDSWALVIELSMVLYCLRPALSNLRRLLANSGPKLWKHHP